MSFSQLGVTYVKTQVDTEDGRKIYVSVEDVLSKELDLAGCQVVGFTSLLYNSMNNSMQMYTSKPYIWDQYKRWSVEVWRRIQMVRRFFGKKVAQIYSNYSKDVTALNTALEPLYEKGSKCPEPIEIILSWSQEHDHFLNGHPSEICGGIDVYTIDAIHRVYFKLWPKIIFEHRDDNNTYDRKGQLRIIKLTEDYQEPVNVETSGKTISVAWNMHEIIHQ